MKPFLFTIVFIILSHAQTKAQEKIEWLSFEEAISKCKKDPRKIFIDVYTDWCGWCKKMDRSTFSDPEVIKYMNAYYYAVKFDAESKKTISFQGETFHYVKEKNTGYHELAATLLDGNMSYPTSVFIVVNKKEQLLANPFQVPGFQNKKNMHLILSYIEEGAFKDVPFDQFKSIYQSPY